MKVDPKPQSIMFIPKNCAKVDSLESSHRKQKKIYKYEDVWHFDKEMTDEQFLQIVI